MGRYLLARLGQAVVVVLGAIMLSFWLANLTGNAVDAALGTTVSGSTRQALIERYGYDQPVFERFVRYVGNALQGDFGDSFSKPVSALSQVWDALPYTLGLVAGAIVLSCSVAIPVAVMSVLRENSRFDVITRRSFMLLQGIPDFFIGILLVLLFAVTLGWLPSFGVSAGVRSYILPVIALSLPLLSTLTRLVRSQLLDILRMEFVTALRVKGLTWREIVLRHAIANALPAIVTYLALQLGWLLSGTIVVEIVFGIPGVGSLVVASTTARDVNVVEAVVVVVAITYVVLNLLADLAVRALDPRTREVGA